MLATLLLTLALTNPVPKDAPVEAPKGPAPLLNYFKAEGELLVRDIQVAKAVPIQRQVEVARVVNGQEVKETITVTEYQTHLVTQSVKVPAMDAAFATAGGKKLTAKEALERVKDGAICVVMYKPHAPEAAYLKAFKDETLVITLPAPQPQPIPGPVPVPLPKK